MEFPMLVVACPRCRIARVVEDGRKTASCGSCGRVLDLADLRPQWRGADANEARQVVGETNARLQGRTMDLVPPAPRARNAAASSDAARSPRYDAARHDDPWSAAAADARGATGEAARVDRIARTLSAALGEFHEGDLQKAMHLAGVPSLKARDHLERMIVVNVLFEPRPGRYRAF